MNRRFMLPAPAAAPAGGVGARMQAFVLRTWRGRILLAALALGSSSWPAFRCRTAAPALAHPHEAARFLSLHRGRAGRPALDLLPGGGGALHRPRRVAPALDRGRPEARGIEDLLRESAEKERMEEELRSARQIQMSLLPQGSVSMSGLRMAALCLPAAEVGGDYYDLLPLSETRLGVVTADVSGKGTSAALYMAELRGSCSRCRA